MSVSIKSASELDKMRVAGRLAAEVLEMIKPQVAAGITTGELDRICHDYITGEQQAIPAPLNYNGFPRSICTSVNEVVCHGIPSDSKKLKNGDIVNIDVTVIKDGYHGDTSIMVEVGDVKPHASRLIQVTQECLYRALALSSQVRHWAISATLFSNMQKRTITRSSGSTVATASAKSSMRTRRFFTMAARAQAWLWSPA